MDTSALNQAKEVVKSALAGGKTIAEVREFMRNAGYQDSEIDYVLAGQPTVPQVKKAEKKAPSVDLASAFGRLADRRILIGVVIIICLAAAFILLPPFLAGNGQEQQSIKPAPREPLKTSFVGSCSGNGYSAVTDGFKTKLDSPSYEKLLTALAKDKSALGGVTGLKCLNSISICAVEGADLSYLGELPELMAVEVSVSSSASLPIGKLPKLERLSLGCGGLVNGMVGTAELGSGFLGSLKSAELKELEINYNGEIDASQLAALTTLERLSIAGASLKNPDNLKSMSWLASLELNGISVGGAEVMTTPEGPITQPGQLPGIGPQPEVGSSFCDSLKQALPETYVSCVLASDMPTI